MDQTKNNFDYLNKNCCTHSMKPKRASLRLYYLFLILFFLAACKTSDLHTSQELYNPKLSVSVREKSDSTLPPKLEISLQDLQKLIPETTFEVKNHPVYKEQRIVYKGFYFKDVIRLLSKKLKIQDLSNYIYSVWSSDNFSAFISPDDMQTADAFLAWREVHANKNLGPATEDGLWTAVEKHGSPGPFYLVWNHPEKTYWQKWPFKIVDITFVNKDISKRFDSLIPDDDFMRMKGYRLILKNCISCHKISDIGFGQMGPDLTGLAKTKKLADFTKQVRTPEGRMIAFSSSDLSDDDIKSIYLYLSYLNRH